jgi:PIN domain nuclease of toxin-antitoxin system
MEGHVLIYLLDTATWINYALMPAVFPARIKKLLDEGEPKGLCSISLLETAILHRLGRLALNGPLHDFFASAIAQDVELLELTPAVAAATNELPKMFQGDPFDRTITATAKTLSLILITPDDQIRDAACCRVEYYPFKPSRVAD